MLDTIKYQASQECSRCRRATVYLNLLVRNVEKFVRKKKKNNTLVGKNVLDYHQHWLYQAAASFWNDYHSLFCQPTQKAVISNEMRNNIQIRNFTNQTKSYLKSYIFPKSKCLSNKGIFTKLRTAKKKFIQSVNLKQYDL